MILSIFVSAYDSVERVATNQDDLPWAIYISGSLLVLVSLFLIAWVLRTNKFAGKVVYKQTGQKLITTGPYRYVRHPFNSFMISLLIGWPWVMGSLWKGLIASMLSIPVLMRCTYHEEDFLVDEFGPAYQHYRQEVPYRMIPWLF